MCDTMCIVPDWSEKGVSLFAKNSDRSPNEPLLTLRIPAAVHEPNSVLDCTYISISQVEFTREMILYKPTWMWGAEMGVNDAHVAIGNEAVFTKAKRGEPSLIGMDLLRLGLERSGTAAEAVEVILELLDLYGQGGNCGFDKEFHYDNSFLISDPKESYVLETSAKDYAVIKVADKYAISNRLSITADHRACSSAVTGKDFAKSYTEPVRSFFAESKERRNQAMSQLSPSCSAAELMQILRTHKAKVEGKEFSCRSTGSICMHAGGAIGDQTTGSVVAVLRESKPITLWSTGCSTPCIAAFKPVFWGSHSPPLFSDENASLEYWLKRERLHRAVIAGKVDVAALRKRIKELESKWLKREGDIMSADSPCEAELANLSAEAHVEEDALIDEFSTADWANISGNNGYARYWKTKNERLGRNVFERTLDARRS